MRNSKQDSNNNFSYSSKLNMPRNKTMEELSVEKLLINKTNKQHRSIYSIKTKLSNNKQEVCSSTIGPERINSKHI